MLLAFKEQVSQFFYRRYNSAFSQGGEDLMLAGLFLFRGKGFFVDIGAFHPYIHSNTYMFYKRGWRGINIDARPGSMSLFNKFRPGDVNIEAAISDVVTELDYIHMKDGEAMNSFMPESIEKLAEDHIIKGVSRIKTVRLDSILYQYRPEGDIDFFSIDVEGMELQVLRSNDWNKYRPKAVLLETFDAMLPEAEYDKEFKVFFHDVGYRHVVKTMNAIIFIREDLRLNEANHILFK